MEYALITVCMGQESGKHDIEVRTEEKELDESKALAMSAQIRGAGIDFGAARTEVQSIHIGALSDRELTYTWGLPHV